MPADLSATHDGPAHLRAARDDRAAHDHGSIFGSGLVPASLLLGGVFCGGGGGRFVRATTNVTEVVQIAGVRDGSSGRDA